MNKLQQVKAKIIEAVPEIMEYRCNGCNRRYAEYVNGCPRCWVDEWSREKNYERYPNRHVGLTPRPVRSSDILRAVYTVVGEATCELYEDTLTVVIVDEEGDRFTFDLDLSKDNLDLESEETINFLYDILCKQNQSSK